MIPLAGHRDLMEPGEDRTWSEQQWKAFLEGLVSQEIVKWSEITPLILGSLNPPQVGTSMTGPIWQRTYGKGETWTKVREWLYGQKGKCERCGTRIQLEKAHIKSAIDIGEKLAHRLENVRLLCKRCNAIERPSHKMAGKTFLTTESALMWMLFQYKPETYKEYERLCRNYGLTMANIRFQEAWAVAIWLSKEGKYITKEDQ